MRIEPANRLCPNLAFNRTPGYVASFFRACVAGRRLT